MAYIGLRSARPAIERLHQNLSAILAQSLYPVTVSMGALIFRPDPSLDRATLMHEADGYMYAGKAAGKGQVRIATLRPTGISAIHPMPMDAVPLPTA